MENHEEYLDALTTYARTPESDIPPVLDQYLNGVAKNGETLFQWHLLKPLIVGKMDQVIRDLRQGLGSENIPQRPNVENVRFDVMQARIMDALHKFNGAPFTIQRLCELLMDPKRHYKRSDKFMRGLEKNVLVVSTVDPFGRKVVSESNKTLVNGMDINGSPFATRDPHTSNPLPPVPGWVTPPVYVASHSHHTSPTHDSSSQHMPNTQDSLSETGITSNGVSSGLVSSLYTDPGEQPLSVHAEEVVEETVVTMDTNDVANVATDGGEGMAEEEEDEEMGGEDTNASSSSSSSSSSEELSATELSDGGTQTPTAKVSSSSQSSPHSRPWAALAEEGDSEKTSDCEASPKKIAEETSTAESNHSETCSTLPLQSSSPSSKLDCVSSPSTSPSSQPAASLSWQSINTSQEESPHKSDLPASICTSTNVPTQTSTLVVTPEDSFGVDVVTTSSTSADTVTVSTTGQISDTIEESLDSNTAITDSEVELNSSAPCDNSASVPESSPSSASMDDGGLVHSSPLECNANSGQTVCSEAVASSTDTLLTAYSPANSSPGNMECDSVAGLERLVGSVPEPSSLSLSSPSSQPPVPQLSSLSSSPSAATSHQSPVSDNSLPTQSSDLTMLPKMETADPDEPEAKRRKFSDTLDSSTSPSHNLPSPEEEVTCETSEAAVSEKVVCSEIEEFVHVDSTADTTSDTMEEGSGITDSDAVAVASSEVGAGDAKVETEEREPQSSSPPSQRSSSDSMGFDVCGDGQKCEEDKETGEESVMRNETVVDEGVPQAAPDTCQEPMDEV